MKSGRSKIYCIMWKGCNLSDAACDALFCAACDCAIEGKDEKRVKNDDVEGIVHTEFQSGITGSIGGIIFYGDIATEEGDSKVTFLVTAKDLEEARHNKDARWVSREQFMEEMQKSRSSHQWN